MKTVREWLETIADKEIREAALSQVDENWVNGVKGGTVNRLDEALYIFNDWKETKEGVNYWDEIHIKSFNGELETREIKSTRPKINEAKAVFNDWFYNQKQYTKTKQEDGTIILTPKKKKVKVWIEVYLSEIDNSICVTEHLNKEQLDESIKIGKFNGETLVEVIEREYEI